jgi:hypothetical protein
MTITTLTPWKPGLGMTAFDNASNYAGDAVEGYFVTSQNRDSDVLTRSNYECILRDLTMAAENAGAPDCVLTPSFGHWAVGHVDQICLAADAPESVLRLAESIKERLSDYPIYNEDHFSDLEWKEAAEYWDNLSPRERVRMAHYERDRCHWLQHKPVWVYGRLDWRALIERANNGDNIASYLEESMRTA